MICPGSDRAPATRDPGLSYNTGTCAVCGGRAPLYDNLSSGMVISVHAVWVPASDIPEGDPHLFGGVTYDPRLDEDRLTKQLGRVWDVMSRQHTDIWLTLAEISARTGDPQASVSARLRDLRKPKFGGYDVQRRRRGPAKNGLFEYRLIPHSGGTTDDDVHCGDEDHR